MTPPPVPLAVIGLAIIALPLILIVAAVVKTASTLAEGEH